MRIRLGFMPYPVYESLSLCVKSWLMTNFLIRQQFYNVINVNFSDRIINLCEYSEKLHVLMTFLTLSFSNCAFSYKESK